MKIDKKQILIFLPFACFILGYFVSNIIIGNKTYITPQLTGLSIYEAVKLTSEHQINIRILSEKENAHTAPGTILTQKPSPGRAIKSHQQILVSITKAPADLTAPLLLQQPRDCIEKTCNEMHIKCKPYELEYPAPSQSCIAQIPQAHDIINDKKIILYFAKNKQDMYVMPDLNNQFLDEVLEKLKNITTKIDVFRNQQKVSLPHEINTKIIHQKPLAGSLISLNQPLTVQLEIL